MLLSLHLTQNYVISGREKTMRLIDADELKKRAVEVCFSEFPDCGEFDAVGISDIDIMPTIYPESMRPTAHIMRGTVHDTYDNAFCSSCRSCLNGDEYFEEVLAHRYKYCPYCGARMVNEND